MSDQTITAIYYDGVFQPITPGDVTLHEGQKVELSIKTLAEETEKDRSARVERILNLLAHFYDGLSQEEIDEMENAMRRRPNFFGEEAEEGNHFDSNRAT